MSGHPLPEGVDVQPRGGEPPDHYLIEVCRHCGRIARWPGCAHWQSHAGWTMSIRVVPTRGDRSRLRDAMSSVPSHRDGQR